MKEQEKVTGKRWRPNFLPLPTEVPLRYCKHKNDEGEELGVLEEHHCLLDLLAGQPKGSEAPKNKQHYILATADPEEKEQRRKGFVDVRERARMIPGVPIVYVKRSVMILEELSGASEGSRRGQEKDKFREGLLGDRKRKRGNEEDEVMKELMDETVHAPRRGMKKAKGANPLSMPKKKVKVSQDVEEESKSKKRRGKRGKKKSVEDGAEDETVDVGDD